MAEVCVNTPRIMRQQAVVNHLDVGEMHEYSELQSKLSGWHDSLLRRSRDSVCGLGQWGPHRILWFVARIRSCIIMMIYCLTLFIIKWYIAWPDSSFSSTHALATKSRAALPPSRLHYMALSATRWYHHPLLSAPHFQLQLKASPIPKQTLNSILFTRPGVTLTRIVCMGCHLSTNDSLPSILP